jgi:hypothetical protein
MIKLAWDERGFSMSRIMLVGLIAIVALGLMGYLVKPPIEYPLPWQAAVGRVDLSNPKDLIDRSCRVNLMIGAIS